MATENFTTKPSALLIGKPGQTLQYVGRIDLYVRGPASLRNANTQR
ncbi:hypothetical protein CCHR01_04380 [Colletotrichum chrysophilum]|uniref:Uncharacterized protein n=1 Tax=Colletotrichum chrysophilum TaxID=1836956 RepID=A0AAD9AUL9_9PEZI|nr:hypothetical protein CCHR01_04380 [Colletotrichum chrysophilum]